MQRRLFLKTASATTFATLATRNVWAAPTPRIAFGGIGIESSTYSRIRARVEDFTILRGNQAIENQRFQFLKRYSAPFLPTLVATAVPGGPVASETYAKIKAEASM